jgi:predicted GH43/DUF377 family glycosyl hydrolase
MVSVVEWGDMDPGQQLFDYVKKARAAGMTAREIREELLGIGWTAENIREALADTTPSALSLKKTKSVKTTKKQVPAKEPFRLEKFEGNPILAPDETNAWESKFTFNPGAFHDGETVHLLYRAVGDSDVSVLGYASTKNGITIEERLSEPAYVFKKDKPNRIPTPQISYLSGGGWNGGSEDPRLTLLDSRVYLIYTAFDGWAALRMALTSISFDDFKRKNWKWKKPVFISPPGEIHKNWVLFPEKINGKYAILHGISPNVLIDYVDSLADFDGNAAFIKSSRASSFDASRWDSSVRGAGPPPIKTKDGWLLLYHATDHRDPGKYKLGAMLLDLADPTKILHRSKEAILEPDAPYENEGFKAGVVYSCGAVVVDDTLFVYYGGADSVVCVATADLNKFLADLTKDELPKLKKTERLSKK